MVVLGLLLLVVGIVAILAAIFSTSGTASFLGADLNAATLFFLGVAATLALLCGLVLTRAGTGRALRHRREHRRLRSLERERRDHRREEQGDIVVGEGHDRTDANIDRTRQDPAGG
jgi:uncharacterized integral membrane protein